MDTRAKRIYKARLRSEERQRNRILRLGREIRELAGQIEADAEGREPGDVRNFQAQRAQTLRDFAERCVQIAPLVALPALPKPGGRDLLAAYRVEVEKEINPGISSQKIAAALSDDENYIDGDSLTKSVKRVKKQLGPDAFAKGSPFRKLFDQHIPSKK